MTKPNFHSVTDIPCSCGYLGRRMKDESLPVTFDPELNEYSFETILSGGTKKFERIYHCPLCGGVASESNRPTLFETLTNKEARRLERIIDKIRAIEDIEAYLGAPDDDRTYHMPPDFPVTRPQTGDIETGPIRQMTFTRLSKTADVQFTVYSNKEIARAIMPKCVGQPPAAVSKVTKRARRSSRSP
jgi:hypothetical protein